MCVSIWFEAHVYIVCINVERLHWIVLMHIARRRRTKRWKEMRAGIRGLDVRAFVQEHNVHACNLTISNIRGITVFTVLTKLDMLPFRWIVVVTRVVSTTKDKTYAPGCCQTGYKRDNYNKCITRSVVWTDVSLILGFIISPVSTTAITEACEPIARSTAVNQQSWSLHIQSFRWNWVHSQIVSLRARINNVLAVRSRK